MAETLTELVAKITTDATALKKGLADAESAAQKSSKSIQQSFNDIGKSMTNAGKQMSMKVTAPIVALGGAAFKMSGDFDQAFRKVNVMLGASAEEAVNYKQRILEISSATGKSAGEVADAFYTIVSAGHRGADALDILEVAVRGATGGAADAQATVGALTKAMNVFQMSGVEGSSKAMDVFFGIVDSGLLSFEEMANSFPRAASNAAGLGISIEETGATLATLTKVLGSTEQAATATDAVFRLLISPSEAMVKLYEQWGVKSGPEAIKKFGGLTGVLKELTVATGGEVTAIRELFASDEAMKGILPLLTSSYDDYNDAVVTVTNSQGRANDAFDEMSEGPGFQLQQTMTKLKNSAILLGDTLATSLGPIVETIGEKVAGLVNWWQNLDERWQKVIITIAGVLAAAGPLLMILGQMAIGVGYLIKLYQSMNIVMVAHKVAMIASAVATKVVTAAQWLWNAAMSANPIGIVILAIGALIAAIVWLAKNWDMVKEKTIAVWNIISGWLSDKIDAITGFFRIGWEKIASIVTSTWEGILDGVKTAWDNTVSFVLSGVNWLVDKVNSVISLINSIPGVNVGEIAPVSTGGTIKGYATGGIVPGAIGQPQLAVVHGGETIIPANESMGGVTVNFTQPVFFDREDTMNRFVDKISKAIDRKQRLRFGGAYNG